MSQPANTPIKTNPFKSLAKCLPTLFVLLVMAAGWLVVHRINMGGATEVAEESTVDHSVETISLPLGKLEAARIETAFTQLQTLRNLSTVPGRIRYDEAKHVDVKAPMDGTLSDVLVIPGEYVKSGCILAVLRSAEIGQARAEILKRQQQREIANQMLQREATIADNLNVLTSMLDDMKSIDAIEAAIEKLVLGTYRQDILSAYSKMRLSAELLAKIEPLVSSGSIPGRVLRERESDREVSENTFRTARDQATFAATQATLKAKADLNEAERQFNLAWQSVDSLVGYKVDRGPIDLSTDDALSRLEILAPIAGTVESRGYASNERVNRGNSLFVIANTDSLTVAASIRDSDWSAIELLPGTKLSVEVPAVKGRIFEATVRNVGREVRVDMNAVPLIGTIANDTGLLRPGMFVRVNIPVGQGRQVIAVKPESIVQHENQSFVFLDMNEGLFQRADVTIGQMTEDWVEITHGLSVGQSVVTHGAFLLKSELLLKGMSE
jgi:membrane fusion protein, heavy metal efflux system